jgi:hypothetical protein
MNEQMEVFMSKLASKFVKPEKVIAHKQNEGSMKSLDISIANQKEDSSLSVGMVTKGKMSLWMKETSIFGVLTNFMMVSGSSIVQPLHIAPNGCHSTTPY